MRKVHRWIALVACLFLLVVGVTGVVLQVQSLTSADEAERERLADKPSAFTLAGNGPSLDDARKAEAKLISLAGKAAGMGGAGASIDRIEYLLRADPPRIVLHAIKPDGSLVRFTAKIADGSIMGNGGAMGEPDPRESFILRLHTGEVLGDAGVVGGVLWGTSLVVLTLSGMWLYWKMYRGRAKVKGWKGILW